MPLEELSSLQRYTTIYPSYKIKVPRHSGSRAAGRRPGANVRCTSKRVGEYLFYFAIQQKYDFSNETAAMPQTFHILLLVRKWSEIPRLDPAPGDFSLACFSIVSVHVGCSFLEPPVISLEQDVS
jgi:hypothetical protein